jgi:hypothetical protein
MGWLVWAGRSHPQAQLGWPATLYFLYFLKKKKLRMGAFWEKKVKIVELQHFRSLGGGGG